MTISSRRNQQAQFNAGLGDNRFGGVGGGGSGMSAGVMLLLADQFTGGINQTFSGVGTGGAVDVTNSAATFHLSRAGKVFIWAMADFAVNSGNTDYAYVFCTIDGSQVGHKLFVGIQFLAVVETLIATALLVPGPHTIKLRAYVGSVPNVGIIYQAETWVTLLGA